MHVFFAEWSQNTIVDLPAYYPDISILSMYQSVFDELCGGESLQVWLRPIVWHSHECRARTAFCY